MPQMPHPTWEWCDCCSLAGCLPVRRVGPPPRLVRTYTRVSAAFGFTPPSREVVEEASSTGTCGVTHGENAYRWDLDVHIQLKYTFHTHTHICACTYDLYTYCNHFMHCTYNVYQCTDTRPGMLSTGTNRILYKHLLLLYQVHMCLWNTLMEHRFTRMGSVLPQNDQLLHPHWTYRGGGQNSSFVTLSPIPIWGDKSVETE